MGAQCGGFPQGLVVARLNRQLSICPSVYRSPQNRTRHFKPQNQPGSKLARAVCSEVSDVLGCFDVCTILQDPETKQSFYFGIRLHTKQMSRTFHTFHTFLTYARTS